MSSTSARTQRRAGVRSPRRPLAVAAVRRSLVRTSFVVYPSASAGLLHFAQRNRGPSRLSLPEAAKFSLLPFWIETTERHEAISSKLPLSSDLSIEVVSVGRVFGRRERQRRRMPCPSICPSSLIGQLSPQASARRQRSGARAGYRGALRRIGRFTL